MHEIFRISVRKIVAKHVFRPLKGERTSTLSATYMPVLRHLARMILQLFDTI